MPFFGLSTEALERFANFHPFPPSRLPRDSHTCTALSEMITEARSLMDMRKK